MSTSATLHLKILLPAETLLDVPVEKILAEGHHGAFCLLPRHVDLVAPLVPGLFGFVPAGACEAEFLAVDEGLLVKCGSDVLVSTRGAVRGGRLGELQATVEEKFRALDDRERLARSAAAKLEADFVRRFVEIGTHARD